ncbi:sensor histidine kinase [Fulvivirga lutimaris]|uniref:sensor histidine kinase n=1 Tax=Fulvivirga lutimaris TaxID=1819566 RepID=UPI0012BC5967|nr:HAMP domain-containing sensor histidine kinase [Fulvivirga lutimaris]MTI39965.1 HAMP domain-containing histidine kinase [Fulvivirga lutimaris]
MGVNIIKDIRGKDRLMLVVLIGIAVLLVYFIASSHYLSLRKSKEHVLQKLRSVAVTASMMIDGDDHQYLSRNYKRKNDLIDSKDDSVYMELHQVLKNIKELNNLSSPIYTMVYNGKSDEYEFIITSSDEPYYRHMFVNYPSQLKMNYAYGGVIDEYQTENGTWLSAFAPIKNSKGEVVANLQVDEKFDDFIAEANADLVKNITVTSVLFVPFMLFLYSFMKRTLEKEEQSKHMLEEQNEEIQLQNELIKESNLKLEEANAIVKARNLNLDKIVKKRTEELTLANEDLATFLYRSSHDIQGPIASIKGIYNLANYDLNPSKEYLGMINDSVMQLDTRVKSINAVFEVKQRKVEKTSVDLKQFISKFIDVQTAQIGCKDYELFINIDEGLAFKIDQLLLEIVLSELIKNSFQFKSDNRLVLIVDAKKLNNKLFKITFSDNGQGIADEIKGEIFDMFKRGHEKSQGSGLGLYAVNLAINKLNGKIEVFSDGGSGTTFEITLPIG